MIKTVGISNIPTEELESRFYEVVQEIDRLKYSLELASGKAKQSNEYSDPEWYARTKLNIRRKGQEHQILMAEIAKRKKIQRREAESSLLQKFMDVARIRLDPELFKDLLRDAKEQ